MINWFFRRLAVAHLRQNPTNCTSSGPREPTPIYPTSSLNLQPKEKAKALKDLADQPFEWPEKYDQWM